MVVPLSSLLSLRIQESAAQQSNNNNNNNNNNSKTSLRYFSCDYNNDACPTQFNGICEASTKEQCQGGDCFDCDPCHEFHYNCGDCIQHGCLWCPGDAFCSSAPLEEPVWERIQFLLQLDVSSSCSSHDWQSTCSISNDNVFSDPLYDAMQWAYELMQVEPVWRRNITGHGVRVRINDNGVDSDHAELAANFDVTASCPEYAPRNLTTDRHGTALASLIAGVANNNVCSVGIAPHARISSCVHRPLQAPSEVAATLDTQLSDMDISVNAWGFQTCFPKYEARKLQQQQPSTTTKRQDCIFRSDHSYSPCHVCDFTAATLDPACQHAILYYCTIAYEDNADACNDYLELLVVKCTYQALTPAQVAALHRGVTEGRHGKGVIYVFSAGNHYALGVDTNNDGWVHSRYTISVGAVGKDGKHASYSTPGAALLVVAPGGDRDHLSNNLVALPSTGGSSSNDAQCGDATSGTSFAAPMAAGVIALMLQVNSNLHWRDVQAILVETSTKDTVSSGSDWTINAAGLAHSYQLGFGIVNAEAAVDVAETWISLGPEQEISIESGMINLSIADDPIAQTVSTVTITEETIASLLLAQGMNGGMFVTESVVVQLDLIHASRGDLKIILTSPQGTESILHPGKRPENTDLSTKEPWELMTVRSWGENPIGNWTLTLVDERPGIINDCVDVPFEYSWQADDDIIDGAVSSCVTLELAGACANGAVVHSFVYHLSTEGLSAQQACCACGGGLPASTVNMLRSWRLAVYGRVKTTASPTTAPSIFLMDDGTDPQVEIPVEKYPTLMAVSSAPVQCKGRVGLYMLLLLPMSIRSGLV